MNGKNNTKDATDVFIWVTKNTNVDGAQDLVMTIIMFLMANIEFQKVIICVQNFTIINDDFSTYCR